MMRSKEPRAEEMLITRGLGELRRRGRKSSVAMRTEVTFVFRIVDQVVRRSDGSFEGLQEGDAGVVDQYWEGS